MPATAGSIIYKTKQGHSIGIDEFYKNVAIATPYMGLIEEFTLEEYIHFHFRMRAARNKITATDLIQLMGLERARGKQIGNFSSGMKQRVKLALAFYTDSAVVLLDEPSTNLDSKAFVWYRTELQKIPEQCLVIIASNNPEEYNKNAIILEVERYKQAVT